MDIFLHSTKLHEFRTFKRGTPIDLHLRSNLLVRLGKIPPLESSTLMTIVTLEERSVIGQNYTSSCQGDVIGAVMVSA